MSDFNTRIIEEFRANDGVVGGGFEGWPMLLLHHTGAKSGTERVSPLTYQPLDEGYAVFASAGGADHNPSWFHNLMANPDTRIEVGTAVREVRARVAEGSEREEIWGRQVRDRPVFGRYEEKTARDRIPVVVLEPR